MEMLCGLQLKKIYMFYININPQPNTHLNPPQTELQHIWRSRRWLSWLLALAVLLVGFAPLRFVRGYIVLVYMCIYILYNQSTHARPISITHINQCNQLIDRRPSPTRPRTWRASLLSTPGASGGALLLCAFFF